MAQLPIRIENMPDDSGFLGIVDLHAYPTFVSENWTLESLFEHFRSEMGRQTMLLWGTGSEGSWRIDISTAPAGPQFPIARQAIGPITVTGGELLVVNYEILTMAAQFEGERIDRQKDWYGSGIDLPNGDYICTISQLTEPELRRMHDGPDFHLQLVPGETQPWTKTAWFEL
ncbi:hypothetical protein F3087_13335 [Nocardia colli]|uniref:Uncharacterized protein n=1 Tax=Nocardia colli TaxID=2545717 RepID=A0A5N0EIZ5_9NOCA|nr:hypothetical protein [Nocardia colli]KAA8888055.1 hypothetical protein F3087_13335 [Nocardia colli]